MKEGFQEEMEKFWIASQCAVFRIFLLGSWGEASSADACNLHFLHSWIISLYHQSPSNCAESESALEVWCQLSPNPNSNPWEDEEDDQVPKENFVVDELSTHSVCRSCSASSLEVFFVRGNREGKRRRRLRSTKKTRASGVAMEMVTFTIIVDDIVYPDGHSAMACLGGGGVSLCLCLPVSLCLALFLHVLGTSGALHNSFVAMWKAISVEAILHWNWERSTLPFLFEPVFWLPLLLRGEPCCCWNLTFVLLAFLFSLLLQLSVFSQQHKALCFRCLWTSPALEERFWRTRSQVPEDLDSLFCFLLDRLNSVNLMCVLKTPILSFSSAKFGTSLLCFLHCSCTPGKKNLFLSAAPGGGFVSSGSEEFNVHGV